MKAIRYEFVSGEGLFQGLRYTSNIDERISYDARIEIDENLDVPWDIITNHDCKFYFTENGNNKFKNSLERLIDVLSEYEYEIIKHETDIDNKDIIYEDEYQIAIEL